MGRKIDIKMIENPTRRQVTFSKRRVSLFKKAQEISVFCDIDVVLLVYSPSGRLSMFSSRRRVEDALLRYINLPIEKRYERHPNIKNIMGKMEKLRQLDYTIVGDEDKFHFVNDQINQLELKIRKSKIDNEILDASLKDFEPPTEEENFTLVQLLLCEKNLKKSLENLVDRKKVLLENVQHPAYGYVSTFQKNLGERRRPIGSYHHGETSTDPAAAGRQFPSSSHNYGDALTSNKKRDCKSSKEQLIMELDPWHSPLSSRVRDQIFKDACRENGQWITNGYSNDYNVSNPGCSSITSFDPVPASDYQTPIQADPMVSNYMPPEPAMYNQSAASQSEFAVYNQQSAAPESHLAMYNQQSANPESHLAMYNQQSATPESQLAMYNQQSAAPESQFAMYNQQSATPESQLAMYNQQSAAPENQFAMYNQQSATPETQLAMYNRQSAAPESQLAMYNQLSAASESQLAMYNQLSAAPESHLAIYNQHSTIPESQFAMYNQQSPTGEIQFLELQQQNQDFSFQPNPAQAPIPQVNYLDKNNGGNSTFQFLADPSELNWISLGASETTSNWNATNLPANTTVQRAPSSPGNAPLLISSATNNYSNYYTSGVGANPNHVPIEQNLNNIPGVQNPPSPDSLDLISFANMFDNEILMHNTEHLLDVFGMEGDGTIEWNGFGFGQDLDDENFLSL